LILSDGITRITEMAGLGIPIGPIANRY